MESQEETFYQEMLYSLAKIPLDSQLRLVDKEWIEPFEAMLTFLSQTQENFSVQYVDAGKNNLPCHSAKYTIARFSNWTDIGSRASVFIKVTELGELQTFNTLPQQEKQRLILTMCHRLIDAQWKTKFLVSSSFTQGQIRGVCILNSMTPLVLGSQFLYDNIGKTRFIIYNPTVDITKLVMVDDDTDFVSEDIIKSILTSTFIKSRQMIDTLGAYFSMLTDNFDSEYWIDMINNKESDLEFISFESEMLLQQLTDLKLILEKMNDWETNADKDNIVNEFRLLEAIVDLMPFALSAVGIRRNWSSVITLPKPQLYKCVLRHIEKL